MKSTIKCNRGDVVLIPFPFTDLSTVKQRPAVVISSNKFNHTHSDVIVAAITSQIPHRLSETNILLTPAALKLAGLPKSSLIKTGKIVTIDQRLIRKKLGCLPQETLSNISAMLQNIFEIP